jgi:hypothetical protein
MFGARAGSEEMSTPTIDALIQAGYKEWNVPTIWNCDRFFQKLIADDDGKKYYINAKYYDWRKYPQVTHRTDSIEFDVQFRHVEYNEMINVRIQVQDIQKGEELIEQIYTRMECARYDD